MKNKLIVILALSLLTWKSDATQRVRRVPVQGDQIVTVKTSLGIATIIQVPDRPNSVVVGDQDSFKIEYLDQAITIKPLSSGAKSNLYIYTDWRRFNVALISGNETTADYVVYLDRPREKPQAKLNNESNIKWINLKNSIKNGTISLNIKRVGQTKAGILVIEFFVTSNQKEVFKPDWLWITQSGETRPIHNLFISTLELIPQRSISGILQMREIDLNTNDPIRVELRRNKTSYLTIPKVTSWKR